jgi:hypothetical protein
MTERKDAFPRTLLNRRTVTVARKSGKEHPAGQCPADHPVPQRHRWLHDKRLAEPYPLPAESRLLQDLGFMAFTLPQVEILMPRKKPPGAELSPAQQRANPLPPTADRACQQQRQALSRRQSRLWKQGVRDVVMETCCALHNFRLRLTPWQPMV